MTTTPNLPPLPDEDGYILITIAGRPVEVNGYRNSTMEAYALAAYQAGRDAALEEAAHIPRAYAMTLDSQGWGNRFPDELTAIFNASTNMAGSIRALKSETK